MRWPWTRKPDREPVTMGVHDLVAFMRSRVSWGEWCRMDDETREAFALAGDLLDTERAAKVARLLQDGDAGLGRLVAHIDDGAALRAAVVRREATLRRAAGGGA